MFKLKIIIGSVRNQRFGDKPAHWMLEQSKQFPDFNTEVLDLLDYPMPFFAEAVTPSSIKEPYTNEAVQRFTKKIEEADAFILVTSEYNHGYPASLKNALDYVYQGWNNKPVAMVAYGNAGGARAVEQLRQVVIELQMAPIRQAVHIVAPWNLVDAQNTLKPGALDPFQDPAKKCLAQLLWWTKALKAAREQQA